MAPFTRRLRSLLIALAVLALSAGAVLAGRSALSAPARPDPAVTHVDGSDSETGEAEETEAGEAPDADGAEPPEAPEAATETDASTVEHPDNHGKLVSEAAQGPRPEGSANHGAFVRTIARDNAGQAAAANATPKKRPTKTP